MGCASSKGTGGDRAPRIVGKGGAGAGAAGAAGVDAKNLRVKVCIKAAPLLSALLGLARVRALAWRRTPAAAHVYLPLQPT